MFGCTAKSSWEPNLNDALSDPIVRTMMIADHVDPQALALSLRATAQRVAQPRTTGEPNSSC